MARPAPAIVVVLRKLLRVNMKFPLSVRTVDLMSGGKSGQRRRQGDCSMRHPKGAAPENDAAGEEVRCPGDLAAGVHRVSLFAPLARPIVVRTEFRDASSAGNMPDRFAIIPVISSGDREGLCSSRATAKRSCIVRTNYPRSRVRRAEARITIDVRGLRTIRSRDVYERRTAAQNPQ